MPAPDPSSNPRLRILVVDDEPIIVKTTRYILGRRFDVVCAHSVAEGLEKVASAGPFDAAMIDDRMPDGRGPVILQALMERWPHCLRYLVSANLGIVDELDASFFKMVSFVAKPLDFALFLKQLDAALAARPRADVPPALRVDGC